MLSTLVLIEDLERIETVRASKQWFSFPSGHHFNYLLADAVCQLAGYRVGSSNCVCRLPTHHMVFGFCWGLCIR